jgi:hypothetical protein
MTGDRERQATESAGILARLVRNYVELSDVCYRVSVVAHDRRGRFERGHRVRRPHPALLKKIDLDEALIEVYRRFFDSSYRASASSTSTSTSNRRCQGREAVTSARGSASGRAHRSE